MRGRASERRIFRFSIGSQLFGAWFWKRNLAPEYWFRTRNGHRCQKWGLVLRTGDLGHVQLQRYTNTFVDGRRQLNTWSISWWGVRGRRRKRAISFSTFW